MSSSPLAAASARNEAVVGLNHRITLGDLPRKLSQLSNAASTRNAFSKETVEHLVEQISAYANIHGLQNKHLEELLRILTLGKTFLESSKVRVLVKALVPQSKIQSSAVIHLIGALGEGQNKAVYATQVLLLRWLVMVYPFLDTYSAVHQLYGVIFNLIYTANLRSHACHLLALCTRRKDVRPFRIQALMKVYEDHSDDAGVVGLLQIYQSFYPDVILRGTRKRPGFKAWDPTWVQNVILIQSNRAGTSVLKTEKDTPQSRRSNRLLSRNKVNVIPILHTYDASESSVTIEEIENARSLIENLSKLELPSQIGAVFQDDMLRNFLLLKGSDEVVERLDSWTGAALFEEFDVERETGSPSVRLGGFLNQISDYTAMRKILLPSVHEFLKEYIVTWDGKRHRDQILGLIIFVQFSHLNDLKTDFFQRLEYLFLGNNIKDIIALLRFHTNYMRNLIIQYSNVGESGNEPEIRRAVRQYIQYVDKISVRILLNVKSHPNLILSLHSILEFFDCVVTAPLKDGFFEIVYPADSIVYSSVFLGDSAAFSRACGILAVYKSLFIEFTELRAKNPRISKYSEPERGYVDHFNGFLMDISNFFWRFRSFSKDPSKDTNALGCLMPDDVVSCLNDATLVRELSLNSIFTVTHSTIFSRFNAECIRFLEDKNDELKKIDVRHAGPVTSKSLAGLAGDGGFSIDYRVFKMASLEFLRRKGFEGVHALIYSTMKKLREEAGKHNVEAMFEGLEEMGDASTRSFDG